MIPLLLALAAPADPAGQWRTPAGAVIRVERCGAAWCGRIVSLQPIAGNPRALDGRNKDAGKRARTLNGLTILWGVTGDAPKWSGGQVYNPEDGGTYSASITLDGADMLKMKGCVAAFLCRTQVWTRVR